MMPFRSILNGRAFLYRQTDKRTRLHRTRQMPGHSCCVTSTHCSDTTTKVGSVLNNVLPDSQSEFCGEFNLPSYTLS